MWFFLLLFSEPSVCFLSIGFFFLFFFCYFFYLKLSWHQRKGLGMIKIIKWKCGRLKNLLKVFKLQEGKKQFLLLYFQIFIFSFFLSHSFSFSLSSSQKSKYQTTITLPVFQSFNFFDD